MDVTDCRGSPLYPFPLLVGERTNQANLSEILDNDATPHSSSRRGGINNQSRSIEEDDNEPPIFFSLSVTTVAAIVFCFSYQ